MTTIPHSAIQRSGFFLLIAGLFFMIGCATTQKFMNSTVAPAAQGEIKVKQDGNNNYAIKVEVENLAEPERLPLPQNVYVVWADTPNGVKNLGQLDVSKGLISRKLKASLETVTPYKPSRIFITGEGTASATYPSSYVILNTNSF